jgi:hypothetical protein
MTQEDRHMPTDREPPVEPAPSPWPAWQAISEETDDILQSSHRTFLVTRRNDGSVTCHPMSRFYADRRLYMNMYAKSSKFKNLQRDPQVCCLATRNSDDPSFDAVVLRGRARVLPASETLASDAPRAVVAARGMKMEGVSRVADAHQAFAGEDEEDLLKRAAVMAQRIRDRTRIVVEIVPEQVDQLKNVRRG